jgi:hypothetical protein
VEIKFKGSLQEVFVLEDGTQDIMDVAKKIPLTVRPQISLAVKPPSPLGFLTVKEYVEVTEEEAIDNGLNEDVGKTRLAADSTWEIWIEPLNLILKEGSKESYFSSVRALLERLHDKRVKFWLTQEKWNRIDVAMQQAARDIDVACSKISRNIEYLNKTYGEIRIDI